MSTHYPRIRVHTTTGYLAVRDGLSFTFYMRRPHHEVAPVVLRSLEAYRSAVGPNALNHYLDRDGCFHEMDSSIWDQLQCDMLADDRLIFHLTGAEQDGHGYEFRYHGKVLDEAARALTPDAATVVSFWLPTDYLEKHGPDPVRKLALELAAPLPFCSGQGGLNFNCELNLLGVRRAVRRLCFRYPGMDIPWINRAAWHIGTRVREAAWMTFLGQPVLGELGGVEGLRSRLHSPETTVQQLKGERAVVTLGSLPQAGDTEQGNTLPAYRELARVLEPWLYHDPPVQDADFTPEDMLRWERRFLD